MAVAYSTVRRAAPPPTSKLRKKKIIAFGWYGGKFSHLDWLLPLLPACHHYCEPFAGSAAVLLNRAPSPVETYNDLDGEVANFFRVLRDDKERLIETIGLTPFSREEFEIACILDPDVSPLERARRFFVRARQVRTGLAQTASLGRWANCKNTSRAGMSGAVSRWLGSIDEEHRELAKMLNSVKGMVAISNYQCDLMDELYPAPKWVKNIAPARTIHSTKDIRVEALWTNYDPVVQARGQLSLLHY